MCISCLVFGQIQAQTLPDKEQAIEQAVEFIAANLEEDEEVDFTLILDDLVFLYDKPLNVNTATRQDFSKLIMISAVQVTDLLNHIERYGKLRSVFELQAVAGWDLATIYAVLPFVRVYEQDEDQPTDVKGIFSNGQHDLILRWQSVIEDQVGFSAAPEDNPDATRFRGNTSKNFIRYRFTSGGKWSAGFTAEKDVGEQYLSFQEGVFDFLSGHVAYKGKGLIRNAVVGDYQMQFGQGLALWSGLGFGKSAYVMNVKRTARGLRPYTSVEENLFFRGGAVTLGKKNLELTLFYSNNRVDGNIVGPDTLDAFQVAQSFYGAGLHRTDAELERKDAVTEQRIGGRLEWKDRDKGIGVSHLDANFSAPLEPPRRAYNQFAFSGDRSTISSVDAFYIKKNVHLFGEVARSQNGAFASMAGALISMHKNLNVSILGRKYDKDYQSLLGAAFGEGSRSVNETGLYFGLEWKLAKKWTLATYYDQFKFPWLRFRQDAIAGGNDLLAQLNFRESRNNQFYIRLRQRNRERNQPSEFNNIDRLGAFNSTQFRVNAQYKVTESIRFKSRVEWIGVNKENQAYETGWMFAQDIIIKPLESRYSIALRYALFDTESFDTRIYAFESDLLYTYSIPAYFYRGSRVVAMLKYKLARKMDLWLRYSQWYYENRDQVGSGLNQINGQTKSEVKVQLRYRF